MSEVKEHPILFSAPMVRALLTGRKTQTRRIVKKWHFVPGCEEINLGFSGLQTSEVAPGFWRLTYQGEGWCWNERAAAISPYGKPGDRLWVRETWTSAYHAGAWGTAFYADKAFVQGKRAHPKSPHFHATELGDNVRWRPSIHMPRWASRIILEVTEVRVQRLQDISEDDARSEGSYLGRCDCSEMRQRETRPIMMSFRQTWCHVHGEEFKHLWESINGEGSWAKNPWVWAVSFQVVK